MVEGLIKQCYVRISQLEALMEDETLSSAEAEKLAEAYNQEHWLLSQLTGDRGDRRPKQ